MIDEIGNRYGLLTVVEYIGNKRVSLDRIDLENPEQYMRGGTDA